MSTPLRHNENHERYAGSLKLWERLKLCFEGFLDDDAFEAAAAISFYAMVALPQIIVLIISCAGLLIKDQSFQAYLIGQSGMIFGPSAAELLSLIMLQSREASHGMAAVVGLLTLLVTAGSLHAQLQHSLNKVWNIERRKINFVQRYVGDRLVATLTVLATGVLLIASLFFSTVVELSSAWLNARLRVDFLSAERTQTLTTFLLLTAMVALLYKLLPDAHVDWRDVWKGAILTSLLFSVLRYFMAFYLSHASLTVSYGQAGTVVLFLLWIYFSSVIFLFGAEWTLVEAKIKGRRIVSKDLPVRRKVTRRMRPFPVSLHHQED